ncbi:hypothetical protein M7I_5843 [Glarea lozoyensis 74030]|nr:hypothetical protein M7I_5843 [Glarea lozoyensis 74030]
MSHLNLVAFLEPLPGKADRVVEILSEIATSTESDEPTCLRYEITRHTDDETKTEQIIMIEA